MIAPVAIFKKGALTLAQSSGGSATRAGHQNDASKPSALATMMTFSRASRSAEIFLPRETGGAALSAFIAESSGGNDHHLGQLIQVSVGATNGAIVVVNAQLARVRKLG